MKPIFLAILLLAFAAAASAQSTIKLFDPTLITESDPNVIWNSNPWGMYKSVQVYLSCPTSGPITSTISGPNAGPLIVDNSFTINEKGICGGTCFTTTAYPGAYLGMPVETAYAGVGPFNVNREITGTGLYTFALLDFGYSYGNTAVYLTTSCSIIPINTPPADPTTTPTPTGGSVVCHRTNGNSGWLTLNVGPSAVAAHLAHGDIAGPCQQ